MNNPLKCLWASHFNKSRNDLTFDKQGFIGRSRSSSYALKEADKGYEAYIAALTKSFDEHSQEGLLTLPNKTSSFVGMMPLRYKQ